MSENIDHGKFCSTCGKPLHIQAEICPHCGVRAMAAPNSGVSKVALLLITFFLGGLGAHKFYLKKYVLGVLYLLFFWTGIPGLIAFVEFIFYCFKSETDLQQRYPETSGAGLLLAVIVPMVGIAIIGILAAIAIPQFAVYRQRASNAAAISDLRNCRTQTEAYYADYQTYPTQNDQITCGAAKGVAIYYRSLGPEDFQIISFHKNGDTAYLMESKDPEMTTTSRTDIETEIADQLGMEGEYGRFHFIE